MSGPSYFQSTKCSAAVLTFQQERRDRRRRQKHAAPQYSGRQLQQKRRKTQPDTQMATEHQCGIVRRVRSCIPLRRPPDAVLFQTAVQPFAQLLPAPRESCRLQKVSRFPFFFRRPKPPGIQIPDGEIHASRVFHRDVIHLSQPDSVLRREPQSLRQRARGLPRSPKRRHENSLRCSGPFRFRKCAGLLPSQFR